RSLRDTAARTSGPALRPLSARLAAVTIGSEPFWRACVFRPAPTPVAKPTWPRPDRRAPCRLARSRAVAKIRRSRRNHPRLADAQDRRPAPKQRKGAGSARTILWYSLSPTYRIV